ncbi:unnamed protein product, partial [Adineta steineri]
CTSSNNSSIMTSQSEILSNTIVNENINYSLVGNYNNGSTKRMLKDIIYELKLLNEQMQRLNSFHEIQFFSIMGMAYGVILVLLMKKI